MATQITPVIWQKSMSLDRAGKNTTAFERFPESKKKFSSFLHGEYKKEKRPEEEIQNKRNADFSSSSGHFRERFAELGETKEKTNEGEDNLIGEVHERDVAEEDTGRKFEEEEKFKSGSKETSTEAVKYNGEYLKASEDTNYDSAADSLVYSQRLRQNLLESRRAFLNFCKQNEIEEREEAKIDTTGVWKTEISMEQRRFPQKKVSFKVKKTPSIYKKQPAGSNQKSGNLNATSVAELTYMFNKFFAEKNAEFKEPEIVKLVSRVNSQKSEEKSTKVCKKPSVKMKPSFRVEDKYVYLKRTVKRKVSVKKQNSVTSQCDVGDSKIGYLEAPQVPKTCEDDRSCTSDKSRDKLTGTSSVRAAIEIFEKKNRECLKSASGSNVLPKTKLAEKKFDNDLKEILAKNQLKRFKVLERCGEIGIKERCPMPMVDEEKAGRVNADEEVSKKELLNTSITPEKQKLDNKKCGAESQQTLPEEQKRVETTTSDCVRTEEEIVEILNIPLLPPRRCDSLHETQMKLSLPPKPLKSSKSEETISQIDQTKTRTRDIKPNSSFLWRRNSQDRTAMASSCGDLQLQSAEKADWEDLYETVEPPIVPEPPSIPPRPNNLNLTVPPALPPKTYKKKLPLPEETDDRGRTPQVPPRSPTETSPSLLDRSPVNNSSIEKWPIEKLSIENWPTEIDTSTVEKSTTTRRSLVEAKSPMIDAITSEIQSLLDSSKKPFHNYEDLENKEENIYETLSLSKRSTPSPPPPPVLPRRREEPLPPKLPSRNPCPGIKCEENESNCYESIYDGGSKRKSHEENNYESIYADDVSSRSWDIPSNRDSIVSSEQQSNSLYGRSITSWAEDVFNTYRATSDLSSSDKSDDWVDLSDNEEEKKRTGFVM